MRARVALTHACALYVLRSCDSRRKARRDLRALPPPASAGRKAAEAAAELRARAAAAGAFHQRLFSAARSAGDALARLQRTLERVSPDAARADTRPAAQAASAEAPGAGGVTPARAEAEAAAALQAVREAEEAVGAASDAAGPAAAAAQRRGRRANDNFILFSWASHIASVGDC